ncbi:hypothetical protein BJ508DRAFT_92874 [Ascobolus immersus RN42]|uniref:Uncharacterized protein n=1 Tax=Ascobolus immersus RN42 TaxID=1160509 RepID=A0A3N4I7Y2_ASCIM|nr:hypothetical protein BJ508DRAFT_92874 [Ascobolus immersus RN42]
MGLSADGLNVGGGGGGGGLVLADLSPSVGVYDSLDAEGLGSGIGHTGVSDGLFVGATTALGTGGLDEVGLEVANESDVEDSDTEQMDVENGLASERSSLNSSSSEFERIRGRKPQKYYAASPNNVYGESTRRTF